MVERVSLVMKALTRLSRIPRTSRAMSALLASRFMSWITAVPPGRSTRCISVRAALGCRKFLNAAWQTIRSKESAANGMAETSPAVRTSAPSGPPSRAVERVGVAWRSSEGRSGAAILLVHDLPPAIISYLLSKPDGKQMSRSVSTPARADLILRLTEAVRRQVAWTVLHNQAIAERLGMSATDLHPLNRPDLE